MTEQSDQQLVERVQKGDKRAFDLLVLKYQHKILALVTRFVHDTHEAQRNRRPPDSDIAADEAEFYEGDSILKDIHSPEREMLCNEIEQVVNRTLLQLPDDLRTALTLREFEGLSYEDIANVMSCPVGTVRSRIFRAREAIDKALKPLLED